MLLQQAILTVKEDLQNVLEREPTDSELADATNLNISQLRKQIGLGLAARNKLIKVRQVTFVKNRKSFFILF